MTSEETLEITRLECLDCNGIQIAVSSFRKPILETEQIDCTNFFNGKYKKYIGGIKRLTGSFRSPAKLEIGSRVEFVGHYVNGRFLRWRAILNRAAMPFAIPCTGELPKYGNDGDMICMIDNENKVFEWFDGRWDVSAAEPRYFYLSNGRWSVNFDTGFALSCPGNESYSVADEPIII